MKNFLTLLILLMFCIATGAGAVTPKQLQRIEQLKKDVVVLFKEGKFDQASPLLSEILAIDPFDKTAIRYQAIARQQVTGEFYNGDWLDIGTPGRLEDLKKRFVV